MKVRKMLGVSVVLVVLAACSSNGSSKSSGTQNAGADTTKPTFTYKNGVLQPLKDGFPNQPITLINGDEAGSQDGTYARTMQKIMAKISPVAIKVQDKPGPQFGMWTLTNEMDKTKAGADGYTPAVLSFTGGALDLISSPIKRDLNMDLGDVNPVIATETDPEILITRADAPWKNWQEFADYVKANPGKVRYLVHVGSQLDIAFSHVVAQQGLDVKRVVGGSTDQITTAIGAGAADVAMSLTGTTLPHYQAGKVRVLLAMGSKAPEPWTDAATTDSIGMPGEPWGGVRGFGVAKDTPESHRLWLAELFTKATQDPTYQERAKDVPGLQVVNFDKAQLLAKMQSAVTYGEPIIRSLHLAWDQQ